MLSEGQLATLAEHGEELRAEVGDVLFRGDVRSGSVKRCATAVGDGAMVVRFIHERFSADVAEATPAHS